MDHGVFTTAHLLRLGATESQIRRAVRVGDLVRLRPGWYARSDADPTVVTAVRAGGVLGCVSALRAHGAWIAPGHGGVHVRGSRTLRTSMAHSCRGDGPPPPTRTAVDPVEVALGCALRCMTGEHWIAACDSVLESGLAHHADIASCLGPRGKTLLSKCDGRSQSGTESLVRVRLRALNFAVVVQPRIAGVGKVDLRVGKLLIECDSKAHHTSLENYQNDRHRDRAALVRGWLKIRLTYDDVVYGWQESLEAIRGVTLPERHRIRDGNRPW
ncbi:MAG: type IV toxin-antitoxin system AbiEi family antitoxin domain-containing protein [Williamsia sp.]|nr:type IV toxin-antitoxin system AbiEi family antitoxin domain-containing protein [Williamsia sp.]